MSDFDPTRFTPGSIYATTAIYKLEDGTREVIPRNAILWESADDGWLMTFADEQDQPVSTPFLIPAETLNRGLDYHSGSTEVRLQGVIAGRAYKAGSELENGISVMAALYRGELARAAA